MSKLVVLLVLAIPLGLVSSAEACKRSKPVEATVVKPLRQHVDKVHRLYHFMSHWCNLDKCHEIEMRVVKGRLKCTMRTHKYTVEVTMYGHWHPKDLLKLMKMVRKNHKALNVFKMNHGHHKYVRHWHH